LTHGFRQATASQISEELESCQRSFQGRLEENRAAYSEGWNHLVDEEIQGVIEGADRENDPNGFTACKSQALGALGGKSHGDLSSLPVKKSRKGRFDSYDSPLGLDLSISDWFASLSGYQASILLDFAAENIG
jgi:hypothetical protein